MSRCVICFVLCSRDLDVLRAQRIMGSVILLPTNQRGHESRSHGPYVRFYLWFCTFPFPPGTLASHLGQNIPTEKHSATWPPGVFTTTARRHWTRAKSAWAEAATKTSRSQPTTAIIRTSWLEQGRGHVTDGWYLLNTLFSMRMAETRR